MKFEIKNRWTGSIIYQDEAESFSLLVQAALKSGANLSGADLSGASLFGADLRSANLSGANLYGADLRSANLFGANLSGAYLRSADLSGANLYGADLRSANLSGADLRSADLRSANLSGAKLSGAKLSGVNPSGALNADLAFAQMSIVPDHGPLFVWKKCRNNVLVRLFIPSKARRSNATGRKCRAERAKVLEVIGAEVGVSTWNPQVTYKTGQWVHADRWEENRWIECGGGIHFFLTRIEAENYN